MSKILLFIILFSVPTITYAADSRYINYECIGEHDYLEITETSLLPRRSNDSKKVDVIETISSLIPAKGEIQRACQFSNRLYKIEIKYPAISRHSAPAARVNIYENNKLLIKDLLFHGSTYGQHVYKIHIYDKYFNICVFSGYSNGYSGAQSYCISKGGIKPEQYPIDRKFIREEVNRRIKKYNKSLKQDK